MAFMKRAEPEPEPEPPAILAALHCGPGDVLVLVRFATGEPVPCYAPSPHGREFWLDGYLCEHTSEAPDGTWVYTQRRT